MDNNVSEMVRRITGQPCTRKEVGSMRSLTLGFGDEALSRSGRQNRPYRLWELGTYSGSWQVMRGANILLAKHSASGPAELDSLLEAIELGHFVSLQQMSENELRIELNNGIAVDFFGNVSDDDEYFHVFCPENQCIEFSRAGWKIGPSDQSWA